jgi:hypothetical protein
MTSKSGTLAAFLINTEQIIFHTFTDYDLFSRETAYACIQSFINLNYQTEKFRTAVILLFYNTVSLIKAAYFFLRY